MCMSSDVNNDKMKRKGIENERKKKKKKKYICPNNQTFNCSINHLHLLLSTSSIRTSN